MPASIHKQCVRFNEPGHAHELTFSCYRRLPLLARDRTRVWLAEAIAAARARQQFELWAYVFMPEHVHPLVYPRRRDYQISSIL
jgi:putative transposase